MSSTTILIAPIRLASASKFENRISTFGLISGSECLVAISLIEGSKIFSNNTKWSAQDDFFRIEDIDQACKSKSHGCLLFLREIRWHLVTFNRRLV